MPFAPTKNRSNSAWWASWITACPSAVQLLTGGDKAGQLPFRRPCCILAGASGLQQYSFCRERWLLSMAAGNAARAQVIETVIDWLVGVAEELQ